jgi:hypothetical protein
MTLKEKFYISKQSTNRFRDEESNTCVKIADEYAIGFAEWLAINCYRATDGNYWLTKKEGDVKKNSTELLEIYKQEKGL